ncbi:class I SAM-dependent methyltransferase [Sedimentitalea todarodis]|uniref:Methyltransferase domain-containing protein n=1 Tax=Sedimentitalea todarodis TaxID=1631240 RepID=A0ABU3VB82_9RHOB|nr:methyltransferase domain-containing protein [Sedimentitalea todarodis]MDU9003443.1 methyltransferase domain-containing protein [Sedimentitalea todarodis]
MDWVAMAAPWLKWEAEIEAAHGVMLDGLMERAALQAGEAVLDIGCGSGGATLRVLDAVGADGRVLAIDIAPPMTERAAARLNGRAAVGLGDAQQYAFQAGGFDAVISQFGLMFFADTGAAFANIRRAVRPGGRFDFVAWGAPVRNDWFAMPRRIATERLGPGEPPDPLAPGPFAFADAARVTGLLKAAGWQAEVETVALDMLPRGTPQELAGMQMDMGAAAMVLRERGGTEADRAVIADGVRDGFAAMERDGQVHVPAEVHYFSAVSPA